MAASSADVTSVKALLPPEAGANGWNDAKILSRWAGTVYRTVREYWVDRVNATAGYIDLTNEGLPASQLYQHAKEMLAYWDSMILLTERISSRFSRSRKIKRV